MFDNITKPELVKRILAELPMLNEADIERAINVIVDDMEYALIAGQRVEIRGFGALSTRERAARKARNPRTGEAVTVPPKRSVHFKPGKELRLRVDQPK